jgi:predicted O-methyltransferase YrrM
MLKWFDNMRERRRNFLLQMAEKYGWRTGAEIGVLAGWTHWYLLDKRPELSMIAVDSWQTRSGSCVYGDAERIAAAQATFNATSKRYGSRSRVINEDSISAAAQVEDGSLDFVFIDGDHTYEACKRDIIAWLPKVKDGGWITGHDYHEFPGVKKAVDESLSPVSCANDYTDDVWAKRKATPETTVCCLKWGTQYGPEYVNILYAMVQRNVQMAGFDFVCLTDNPQGIHPWIRTAPLPYDAPKWWGKMGLYMPIIPGIQTERLLFLDLDVVVTGPLDEMLQYPGDFVMAMDWPSGTYPAENPKSRNGQTSAILLEVGSRTDIWEKYVEAGKPTPSNPGDQEWINDAFPGSMALFPERLVQSYKLHKLAGDALPKCSVVMFHGRPKPPDCGGWVKERWHE